jgi:uncharacterized protein (DUF2237 family)
MFYGKRVVRVDGPYLTVPKRKLQMPAVTTTGAKNVLGTPMESCSTKPLTGFFRTGCCDTGPGDVGLHLVCAVMTEEFLAFSKMRGNDLSTPKPEWGFPGLKSGDRWCLCVTRWKEAFEADMAPKVILESTHISSLEFVSLEELKTHAL